ncbi:MAG: DUF1501 domain-containing protein [Bdellovibrionota bacterium]|nr:DUF1501 domain-containing protein [Bdellovibrionota bacterium]
MSLKRRDFLKIVAGLGFSGLINPSSIYSQLNHVQPKAKGREGRRLILIQLIGGNDGLNTLIPFQDDIYYKSRPKISLKKENVLKINSEQGLHHSLKNTFSLYKEGQMALIQGVGMDNPNLSHFRAMDIIETGSSSNEVLKNGWLVRTFNETNTSYDWNGVVLGGGFLGPLRGDNLKSLSLKNLKFFKNSTEKLQKLNIKELSLLSKKNEALSHILNVEKSLQKTNAKFNEINTMETFSEGKRFPLKKQVETALTLIQSNPQIPVFVLTIPGFDTHRNQLKRHEVLMGNLDQTISSLTKGLKKMGQWDSSLILTYSEFGRRVAENESLGTDHGTANVFFALGGKVRGGVYGKRPSLKNLDKGNLVYTTDYRSIYYSIQKKWFHFPKIERSHKLISFV